MTIPQAFSQAIPNASAFPHIKSQIDQVSIPSEKDASQQEQYGRLQVRMGTARDQYGTGPALIDPEQMAKRIERQSAEERTRHPGYLFYSQESVLAGREGFKNAEEVFESLDHYSSVAAAGFLIKRDKSARRALVVPCKAYTDGEFNPFPQSIDLFAYVACGINLMNDPVSIGAYVKADQALDGERFFKETKQRCIFALRNLDHAGINAFVLPLVGGGVYLQALNQDAKKEAQALIHQAWAEAYAELQTRNELQHLKVLVYSLPAYGRDSSAYELARNTIASGYHGERPFVVCQRDVLGACADLKEAKEADGQPIYQNIAFHVGNSDRTAGGMGLEKSVAFTRGMPAEERFATATDFAWQACVTCLRAKQQALEVVRVEGDFFEARTSEGLCKPCASSIEPVAAMRQESAPSPVVLNEASGSGLHPQAPANRLVLAQLASEVHQKLEGFTEYPQLYSDAMLPIYGELHSRYQEYGRVGQDSLEVWQDFKREVDDFERRLLATSEPGPSAPPPAANAQAPQAAPTQEQLRAYLGTYLSQAKVSFQEITLSDWLGFHSLQFLCEEKLSQLPQVQDQDLPQVYQEIMTTVPNSGTMMYVLCQQEFNWLSYYSNIAEYYAAVMPDEYTELKSLHQKFYDWYHQEFPKFSLEEKSAKIHELSKNFTFLRNQYYHLISQGFLRSAQNLPGQAEVMQAELPSEIQELQLRASQLVGLIQNIFSGLADVAHYASYQQRANQFNLHLARLYRHLDDQEALKFLIQYFMVLGTQLNLEWLTLMDINMLIVNGDPQRIKIDSCEIYAGQLKQAILNRELDARDKLLTFDVDLRKALGFPVSVPPAAAAPSQASPAPVIPAEVELSEEEQVAQAMYVGLYSELIDVLEASKGRMQQAQENLHQATQRVAGSLLNIGNLPQDITAILNQIMENHTDLMGAINPSSKYTEKLPVLTRIQSEEAQRNSLYGEIETRASEALELAKDYANQDNARVQLLADLNVQTAELFLRLSSAVAQFDSAGKVVTVASQAVQPSEDLNTSCQALQAVVGRIPTEFQEPILLPIRYLQALLQRCAYPMRSKDMEIAKEYQTSIYRYVSGLQVNMLAEIENTRREKRLGQLTAANLLTIVRRTREGKSVRETRENLSLAAPHTLGISDFSCEAQSAAAVAGPSRVVGALHAAPPRADEALGSGSAPGQQGPH